MLIVSIGSIWIATARAMPTSLHAWTRHNSLSALGAERVGVRWGIPCTASHGATHLTLPVANATGPLPLRPEGRRGRERAEGTARQFNFDRSCCSIAAA